MSKDNDFILEFMTNFSSQLIGGRYQILRQLGAGGFAKTYLAEDRHRLQSLCVIKQLTYASDNCSQFKKVRELFKREGKTLLRLGEHDNIPYLFAYFQENQEFYLVEEYIEGHSLSEFLHSRKTWDEETVIQFLEEILLILQYVHENGVIHRDIKPDNIMRRQKDHKLVLIDFGGVKTVFGKTSGLTKRSETNPTQIFTPGYAPREQIHGHPEFNSDIYAIGMTAIRGLTGIEPKDLEKDTKTGIVKWREQANKVSDQLADILNNMICEDYQRRYQNVKEVLKDLQKPKTTLVIVGRQENNQTTIVSSIIRFSDISLRLALIVLTPLLILTAFVVGFTTFSQKVPSNLIPSSSSSPIQSPTPTPVPEPTQETKETGVFLRPDSLKKHSD